MNLVTSGFCGTGLLDAGRTGTRRRRDPFTRLMSRPELAYLTSERLRKNTVPGLGNSGGPPGPGDVLPDWAIKWHNRMARKLFRDGNGKQHSETPQNCGGLRPRRFKRLPAQNQYRSGCSIHSPDTGSFNDSRRSPGVACSFDGTTLAWSSSPSCGSYFTCWTKFARVAFTAGRGAKRGAASDRRSACSIAHTHNRTHAYGHAGRPGSDGCQ